MTVQEWLGENNQLGIDIWEKKYRNEEESFEEWLERVSGGNADIKELIVQKKFLFGGRILANRGVPGNRTYSNCYVLTPPEDNLESIFECAKKLARTFSYGGGCGVDLGKLCPKDAKVNNTAKKSSGAVSFMDLYNTTTGLIGQNGRRGALMLSMPVTHPDIEEFIGVKSDLSKVTNANISVRVTDDFMRAVEADEDFELRFMRPESGEEIVKTVRAKELFHKMCEMNWNYAEPGILFWDRIQDRTLLQFDPTFEFAGTNPCAEEPLPAGGSCLLGSLNLSEFVIAPFTLQARFDYNGFCAAVKTAVGALNEVLDEGLELHPLEEQRESVRKWRQIGLGIMGLADMLIKLGITYGSEDAIELCDDIACTMFKNAVSMSTTLANSGSYEGFNPNYVNSCDMIQEAFPNAWIPAMRNSQLLTIAPTGSLSTMIGVSGGIEPIFANHYERRTISLHGEDVTYKVYTPIVKDYMEEHELEDDENLPKYFVVAGDISCEQRVQMQGAFQRWIDASISSTVNLPNDATVEDVYNIYLSAWKHGLKGITIYRAGCAREGILVEDGTKPEEKTEYKRGDIVPVSDNLIGLKRKLITGCGSLHCMAYFDADTKELRETYLSKGSTGGCNNFMTGLSRMISLSARAGVSLDNIIDQLNSCGVCPSYASRKATHGDVSPGSCCPIAVARALKEMHDSITDGVTIAPSVTNGVKCPSCGEELTHEGGCNICKNCGWTKCD